MSSFIITANEQGLLQFGDLKSVKPVTEVDDCNIADVLFISQIYNVKLELKLNSELKVDAYNVQPKLQQTQCCMFALFVSILKFPMSFFT